MFICSACLWVDFINRYTIIERRKMLEHLSLFRKANMVFIKSTWFEAGLLTKMSYYTLRFSQMLFVAICILFLCWNRTARVWTILENISVGYIIFVLFINGPLALSGPSASDTTKRDFELEYTSAKKQLEQLQSIAGQASRKSRNRCFTCRTRRISIIVGVIVREERNFLNQRKRNCNF